jgi:hypothetical protein
MLCRDQKHKRVVVVGDGDAELGIDGKHPDQQTEKAHPCQRPNPRRLAPRPKHPAFRVCITLLPQPLETQGALPAHTDVVA